MVWLLYKTGNADQGVAHQHKCIDLKEKTKLEIFFLALIIFYLVNKIANMNVWLSSISHTGKDHFTWFKVSNQSLSNGTWSSTDSIHYIHATPINSADTVI